jgi:hypothetical protein
MAVDSKEFARSLIARSHEWATCYVAQEYGRIQSRLRRDGLIEWCRSFMWREYMVGCHVPAKVLALLPDDAQDLKLLLTTPILDEWKHSEVFVDRVRALGGDADLKNYAPTDELQARALAVQERKMGALKVSHGNLVDRVLEARQ